MSKMGIAQGFARTNRFSDAYMESLHDKVQKQLQEQGFANRSLLDQQQDERRRKAEKEDAADLTKQTEKANQDAINRQKAAFEADVNADASLDPATKSRALALSALGTSEGLTRAQAVVDAARKTAATPAKSDKAAEYKDKIAELGGWEAAKKADPTLIAKAEVYGVKPEEVKGEKVLDRDKPPSAQEMIDAALAHIKGQKASAQAIEAKLIGERVPAEKAHASAVRIMELEPDERKAAIKFLQSVYGKKNPLVADSIIADWSQPGDFEMPIDPNANPLGAKLETATARPATGPAAAVLPERKPTAVGGTPASQPEAAPAGEISKEKEMSLYEKERQLDEILKKLREEPAE